jgi:hypothetical protein
MLIDVDQRRTPPRTGGGAVVVLVAGLAGCGGASPVQGRYARDPASIEFRSDRTVQHGGLGDTARVEIDGHDSAPATTPRLAAEDSQRFAAPLLGGWGVPGRAAVLQFRSDATFSWRRGIGGTYQMLAADRVRLVRIQNGTPAGQLDHALRIEGDSLTLTAPDGAVTSYQRVR